jgi:TetR/AcrR family transcriptional repressor of nem operon
MARLREFEIDDALEAAVRAFWQNGYEGASLSTLTEALGLQKGSIYKAFHDKRTLFLMALERYLEQGFSMMRATLGLAPSAVQAIRIWGRGILERCSGAHGAQGCLAVNSMVELAPKDAEAANKLEQHWSRVESLLHDVLLRGQAIGEVRRDLPAVDMARILTRWAVGTAVFARAGSDERVSTFEALVSLIEAGA